MTYNFYVKMDGQEFGPYSLEEIKELPLLNDTLITEPRLNGEWRPACEFDFDDLSRTLDEQRNTAPHPINEPQIPRIIDAWNWGAFSLSWLWGICNGIYWPLVIIVCNFIPYVGPVIGLCICIYLGLKGNKLAWDVAINKNVDISKFTESQDKWNMAGIIVLSISIIILLGRIMYDFPVDKL
jgi:hypothetical protein